MKHLKLVFRDRDTRDIAITTALTLPHIGGLLALAALIPSLLLALEVRW